MRTLVFEEYQRMMAAVCLHYGMEETRILRSNKEECVDARATLVSIGIERGFSEAELVQLTGLTQQCINKLRNSVRFREKKWGFRETMKAIMEEIGENNKSTTPPQRTI